MLHCNGCNRTSDVTDIFAYQGKYLCNVCINKGASGFKVGWNVVATPKTFEDYVGQDVIKKELTIMLGATKVHAIPVQHCLFSGSFGLGKTTIAKIFADMIACNWVIINAAELEDVPPNDVVVIDEIHKLKDEESLLGIMDAGKQTILAATTTAGSLSGPLRSRFISLVLEPYTIEELKVMIYNTSNNLNFECPEYLAQAVAQRGKFVARIALFLFKRVYDRVVLTKEKITPETIDCWFASMGIDYNGLDNADRAYLSCLSDKPMGIQNLSALTGLDAVTLQETIEPYLLSKGYVKRTPRGRVKGEASGVKVWR